MNIDALIGLFENLKISERTSKSLRNGLFSKVGDGSVKLVLKSFADRRTPKRLIQKNLFDADKADKSPKNEKRRSVNGKSKRSYESDTDQESKPITIKKVKVSEKNKSKGFAKAFQPNQTHSNNLNNNSTSLAKPQQIMQTKFEPVFKKPKHLRTEYKNYNIDLFLFRIINWEFDWFEEEG
jgi:hypothetical protein